MDPNAVRLQEIEKLVRDNNRMLHAMRRNAFVGGIIKFVVYMLVLVVAPVWIYTVYLQPLMQSVSQTLDGMKDSGAKVEMQFSDLSNTFEQLKSKLPDFMRPGE